MITFCRELLPDVLRADHELDPAEAGAIGDDILHRAEAFAALDQATRGVLLAPFAEEVFDHEPASAPLELKAAVTLVVRNSRLEEAHVRELVSHAELKAITTAASAPLSHFLAARRRDPLRPELRQANPFLGLDHKYPRAWACLSAITDTFAAGGRSGYRTPDAPTPALPSGNELVEAKPAQTNADAIILSAIDPRFDQQLMDRLRMAAEDQTVAFVPSLSRFSRNIDKLMRVIEFVLAHQSLILTTNYLLRPHDVWVRRKQLIKPDSHDPLKGLKNTAGLAGAHREVAREVGSQLAE